MREQIWKVQKIIQGKKEDGWQIYWKMSRENLSFVNSFLIVSWKFKCFIGYFIAFEYASCFV